MILNPLLCIIISKTESQADTEISLISQYWLIITTSYTKKIYLHRRNKQGFSHGKYFKHKRLLHWKTFLNISCWNGYHCQPAAANPNRSHSAPMMPSRGGVHITNIAMMVGLKSRSFYDRASPLSHPFRQSLLRNKPRPCVASWPRRTQHTQAVNKRSHHIWFDQQITCSPTCPLSTDQRRHSGGCAGQEYKRPQLWGTSECPRRYTYCFYTCKSSWWRRLDGLCKCPHMAGWVA